MDIKSFSPGILTQPDFGAAIYSLRVPSGRDVRLSLIYSVLVFILSGGIYMARAYIPFAIQGWVVFILGTTLAFSSSWFYRWNPLYLLITGLLAIPPLYSGALVLLEVNGGIFCAFGQAFHTSAVASKVMLLTVIAISVSSIGWGLAMFKQPLPRSLRAIPFFDYKFAGYAVVALFSGLQTSILYGDFIWNVSYYSAPGTPFLGIQIFPTLAVIGVLGMFAMLVYENRGSRYHYLIFLAITVYVLMFCMFFRGGRLEVVAAFIGAYFLWLDAHKRKPPIVRIFISGFIIFILLQMWGVFRMVLANPKYSFINGVKVSTTIILKDVVPAYKKQYPPNRYPMTTIGDIVATFYMTVGLVDEGKLPLLYGKSYFEYIPRTLPKFLYPERPHDLAWIFLSVGEKSGGGLYSLSEAYMNFGFAGCVAIPLLFSFLIARTMLVCIAHGSFQGIFLYVFVLSFMLRGVWYGYFALYKSIIAWFFVEVMLAAPLFIWRMCGRKTSL